MEVVADDGQNRGFEVVSGHKEYSVLRFAHVEGKQRYNIVRRGPKRVAPINVEGPLGKRIIRAVEAHIAKT